MKVESFSVFVWENGKQLNSTPSGYRRRWDCKVVRFQSKHLDLKGVGVSQGLATACGVFWMGQCFTPTTTIYETQTLGIPDFPPQKKIVKQLRLRRYVWQKLREMNGRPVEDVVFLYIIYIYTYLRKQKRLK